jgi:DNA polymerase (family 10)
LFHDAYHGPPGEDRDQGAGPGDESGAAAPAPECPSARTGRFTLEEVTALDRPTRFDLVRPCDIRGILHSHSRYCDGAHTLASMVETAREIGLEYLGISDHFRSESHRDGLDVAAVRAQRREIEALRADLDGFELLQGVELDANPDGSLPVDDGILAMFDYVIVSFPEHGDHEKTSLTDRVVRVARHPGVTILGKPVGDFMLRSSNGRLDMEAVIAAAAEGGTAVEINANPQCPELDWSWCRRAQDLGVAMAISPDAHRAARLVDYRHGAQLAQSGGICCGSILNTLSAVQLRRYLADGAMPGA